MPSVVRAGRMDRTAGRPRPGRRSSSGVWRAPRRRRGRRGGGRRGLGRQPQPPRGARVLSASMVAAMPSVGSGVAGVRVGRGVGGEGGRVGGRVRGVQLATTRRRGVRVGVAKSRLGVRLEPGRDVRSALGGVRVGRRHGGRDRRRRRDDGEVVWTTNLPMMMTSGKVPPARRLSECARRGSRAGARSSGGPPERRRRDRDTHAAPRPSARVTAREARLTRGLRVFQRSWRAARGDLFEPRLLGNYVVGGGGYRAGGGSARHRCAAPHLERTFRASLPICAPSLRVRDGQEG